jgi:hypothetical protein
MHEERFFADPRLPLCECRVSRETAPLSEARPSPDRRTGVPVAARLPGP